MEQVQDLIEILEQTPEMALWALSVYFLYVLLKMASWIFALKIIAQQFIKRLFDYKDKALNNKRGHEIAEMFEKQKISGVDYGLLIELLNSVKKGHLYIHESYLKEAIEKIKST